MNAKKQIAPMSAAVRLTALVLICGCASTSVVSATDASADPPVSLDAGLPDTNVRDCPNNDDPLSVPEKCFDEVRFAFVNVAAPAGGNGTKATPFQKLADALAGAKPGIAMAQGDYKEALVVERGVKIFGGLAPSFVARGEATTIASGGPVGLRVKTDALLSSVSVRAEAATEDGGSSVGIVAEGALTLLNGTVTAGAGKAGVKGDNGANYVASLPQNDPTVRGNDAMANAGGLTKTCSVYCTDFASTTVTGGRGGAGDMAPSNPTSGAAGTPMGLNNRGIYTESATPPTPPHSCTPGQIGQASPNANGGKEATFPFAVTGTPLAATKGDDGTLAKPGQGGGGGGGMVSVDKGGGGGGGCGGCGGGAGKGGQSGGSSIAVLLLAPGAKITGTTLVTGLGGAGGPGGAGQTGQLGGDGGERVSGGDGCPGGRGGPGGHGGGGGGGAGGHSVGVAYRGARPAIEGLVPKIPSGPAGGGAGGTTGSGATAAGTGAQGLNQAELMIP